MMWIFAVPFLLGVCGVLANWHVIRVFQNSHSTRWNHMWMGVSGAVAILSLVGLLGGII